MYKFHRQLSIQIIPNYHFFYIELQKNYCKKKILFIYLIYYLVPVSKLRTIMWLKSLEKKFEYSNNRNSPVKLFLSRSVTNIWTKLISLPF